MFFEQIEFLSRPSKAVEDNVQFDVVVCQRGKHETLKYYGVDAIDAEIAANKHLPNILDGYFEVVSVTMIGETEPDIMSNWEYHNGCGKDILA